MENSLSKSSVVGLYVDREALPFPSLLRESTFRGKMRWAPADRAFRSQVEFEGLSASGSPLSPREGVVTGMLSGLNARTLRDVLIYLGRVRTCRGRKTGVVENR